MKKLSIFLVFGMFVFMACDSISVSRKNDSNIIPDNDEELQSDSDEITNDIDLLNDELQTDDPESDDPDKNDSDFISQDNEIETDDENYLPDNDESYIPDNDDNMPDDIAHPDEDFAGQIELTIGTYNLENFFDTECDSGTDGSGDCYDFFVFSISEFNSKLSAVSTSIRSIGSDIQIIVEIEDDTTGNAILNELSDIYDEVYIAVKSEGNQSVGVLTKGTITKVINHGSETDFAREFPEIHISYLGKKIIVFPAHFKSKSNDDPARRLREATKAAEIINEVADMYPDSLIVMGGDLNDLPGSDPLNALDSANLLRTASDLPLNDQCTYNYDGCSRIDHIYLSVEAAGEYIAGSAEVIKDGGCGSGSYCLGSSDHAALKADFNLGEEVIEPNDDTVPDADTSDPEFSSIYDIKQSIIPSSTLVSVRGIVTAVNGNAFFIQTLTADYNSTLKEKYSALFVYISSSVTPAFTIPSIGNVVEVSGTTDIYYGEIQLGSITDVKITGSSSLPTPLVISPSSVRSAEYEAVLVNVGTVSVSSVDDGYNSFVVNGGLLVDDDIFAISPTPIVGESYSLKGVMRYSFSEYRLLPRYASDVTKIY